MLFFVGQVGGALGPIATGRIFDVTHSYQIAFIILLCAGIAAVLLAAAVRPIRRSAQNP
jgi:cyanate permease